MKHHLKLYSMAAALVLSGLLCLPMASAQQNVITVDGAQYTKPVDGTHTVGGETWNYDFDNQTLQLLDYQGGTISIPTMARVQVRRDSRIDGLLEVSGTCLLQIWPDVILTIRSEDGCMSSGTTLIQTAAGSQLSMEQIAPQKPVIAAQEVAFGGSGQVKLQGAGTGIEANGTVSMSQRGIVEVACEQQAVACTNLLVAEWNGSFQDAQAQEPGEQPEDGGYFRTETYVVGKRNGSEIVVNRPEGSAKGMTGILACYDDQGRMIGVSTASEQDGFWHFPSMDQEGSWKLFAVIPRNSAYPVCRSYDIPVK